MESTQKNRNKFIGKYANLVQHTKNKGNISGETTSSSAIDQSNGKIIVTNVDEKDARFFKGIEYFGSQSGKKRATTGKTESFVYLNINKSVTEVSPQQARLQAEFSKSILTKVAGGGKNNNLEPLMTGLIRSYPDLFQKSF